MSQVPHDPNQPAWSGEQDQYYVPQQLKTSGMAIASLVCGILGLVTFCVIAPSALAVVLGGVSLPTVRRGEARGRGLAIAGIVLGSVGLIVGVLLLIANNPRKKRPQLPYGTLYRFVPLLLVSAALAAVAGGAIGNAGMLTWVFDGFADAETADILRRQSFMTAWGAHMGAYVGGALAALTSVAMVVVFRKRLSNATKTKNE